MRANTAVRLGVRDVAIALLLGAVAMPALLAAQEEKPDSARRCICVAEGPTVWSGEAPLVWRDADRSLRIFSRRAVIGVSLGQQEGSGGVRIEDVTDGGPADRAGLRAGDVLTAIDDVDLTAMDAEDAADALVEHLAGDVEPGDTVQVVYERDGTSRRASIATEEVGLRSFAWSRPGGAIVVRPDMPDAPDMDFSVVTPRMGHIGEAPEVRARVLSGLLEARMHGLRLIDMNPDLGSYFNTDHGALVAEADDEAPLGLHAGDVILSIDGRQVEDAGHAYRILQSYRPDEELSVEIMRQQRRQTLTGTVR